MDCEFSSLDAQNRGCAPFMEWIANNISLTMVHDQGKNRKNKPEKTLTMLQLNSAMHEKYQSFLDKGSVMLRRKAFLHWYTSEGMD